MTIEAADSAESTLVIGTMANSTLGHILSRFVPVEGGTVLVHPGLTNRVIGSGMTIMTGRRRVAIGPVQVMALIADRSINGKARMRRAAVGPGFACRDLAAGFAEVALGTADSTESTQVVGTVTYGTVGHILSRCIPVEGCTVLVQPGLTNRVIGSGMTIVTGSRRVAIRPVQVMALVTDRRINCQAVVWRGAMRPSLTGRDLTAGFPEVALGTTDTG